MQLKLTKKRNCLHLSECGRESGGGGGGVRVKRTWLLKAEPMHCGHKVANAKNTPLSHTHTCPGRRKAMPFPFTGEQEKETPWRFSYLVGESEEL